MFTGLVEGVGRIADLKQGASVSRLTVEAPLAGELHEGESIAVDGACLTVTERSASRFSVEMTETTLAATTLGSLTVGAGVNLERALKLSDRLGGHLVSGHVDGVGRLLRREQDADTARFWIEATPDGGPYLVERGSIAVAGVSLTIVNVKDAVLAITLIPTTLHATTLGGLHEGAQLNLEYDLVAKYLWRWASREPQTAAAVKGASE